MSREERKQTRNMVALEKLKEALHFVIARCGDASRLGAVRLNKIVWFADSAAFRETAVSITGDTYVKRKLGPVPKHVLRALRELEEEGKIVVREVPYTTKKSLREFISLKHPDTPALSTLDTETLSAYTDIICREYTANQISDISHDQVWEAAEEGEEIPLYTVFASRPGSITNEVRTWANSQAQALAA